jgi:hypothetical protein
MTERGKGDGKERGVRKGEGETGRGEEKEKGEGGEGRLKGKEQGGKW